MPVGYKDIVEVKLWDELVATINDEGFIKHANGDIDSMLLVMAEDSKNGHNPSLLLYRIYLSCPCKYVKFFSGFIDDAYYSKTGVLIDKHRVMGKCEVL